MSEKKYKGMALFDLDGTLLNNNTNEISESTCLAIRLLKQNGYVVALCTGRDMETHYSAGYRDIVQPDAIIHQNGGKITVGDEVIFRHTVSHDLIRRLYDYAVKNGICVGTSIGGEDFFLYPEKKIYADQAYNKFLTRHFVPFEEIFNRNLEVTGLAYAGDLEKEKPIIERDFPELELFGFSSNAGADVVERGFSKAEGMRRLCDYYGISTADTYAFGDSNNDVPVLKAAGVGIAMGNGDESAKEAADYVTEDFDHDGIYRACVHFGLIEDIL